MNIKLACMTFLFLVNGLYADISLTADAEIALKTTALVGLEASRLTLIANREAALLSLKTFEKTSGLVIDGTRAVLKAATSTFQIRSMKAHSAAKDFIAGKLPTLDIKAIFLGKNLAIKNLTFDFKNPEKSIQDLIKKLLDSVAIF